MEKIRLGYALCGSFCTLKDAIAEMLILKEIGYDITPIISESVSKTDTRFGKAEEFTEKIKAITAKEPIVSIKDAEPIGPKKLLDALVIAPCTGNTLGKLANGITDTSVTMASKAHLRNERPLIIAVSTNDALGTSAKNIGTLMNCKNIYFVPFKQDMPFQKHNSCVADFTLIGKTVSDAINGKQTEPMLIFDNLSYNV